MRATLSGRAIAVRFMLVSMLFLLIGIIDGLMHPTKFMFKDLYAWLLGIGPQHVTTFFTSFVIKIHTHIALVGWVTTGLMGLFYFMAEEIKGGNRYRPFLCNSNLLLQVIGVLILAVGFHLVGVVTVPTGHAEGTPEFRAVAKGVQRVVIAGGAMLLLSGLLFIYNISFTLLSRGDKLTQQTSLTPPA